MSPDIGPELLNIEQQVAAIRERIRAQVAAPEGANDADTELLKRCLELFERATFHDGRYAQREDPAWQATAQKMVRTLSARLDVTPYAQPPGESHGTST